MSAADEYPGDSHVIGIRAYISHYGINRESPPLEFIAVPKRQILYLAICDLMVIDEYERRSELPLTHHDRQSDRAIGNDIILLMKNRLSRQLLSPCMAGRM